MSARDVLARLRALGRDFTPAQMRATRAIFAPRVLRPEQVGCEIRRDLAYGPDARHRLDVFMPTHAAGQNGGPAIPGAGLRRALVFVHGGGFVQGDKGAPDAPFYNNVGAWAVAQGHVGITLTYRLAPLHPWPAGSADLDLAIGWLRANYAALGIDPDGIVLCGQSAGAVHVAGYLARHGCATGSVPAVAAAVLLSGIYDLARAPGGPAHSAYYGADRSLDAQRSTLAALVATTVPCLFAVCELDPPEFQLQALAVVEAVMAGRHEWPRMMYLAGHNHLSSVLQLGSDVDGLGPLLAAFIGALPASMA
jgi:triacylglycerol lipase